MSVLKAQDLPITFITGNQNKADYLAKWLGLPILHQKIDLTEIQSLDLSVVTEHKARSAYDIIKKPVLVEDVSLVFHGLGRLPGTYVKWFLEEIGVEGLMRLSQNLTDKTATASVMYCLYDGKQCISFTGSMDGSISSTIKTSLEGTEWKNSLSWNALFIPKGSTKTYAEMKDDELKPFSHRAVAIEKLKKYLTNI